MKFQKLPLNDAYLIEMEKREDDRGIFARFFCENEFSEQGLVNHFVQINFSLSKKKGTLRGMHYQIGNYSEIKLVRCIRGAFWDCILDLRPSSSTYLQWFGIELSAENKLMIYIPKGFAHATLTLEDDTEALYLMSNFYSPINERGIRWNDPKFNIEWPANPIEISEKDSSWPNFVEDFHNLQTFK